MSQYNIGNIEILKVQESVGPTSPKFLFETASYQDIEKHHDWLQPHFVDATGKLIMSVHSYIIKTRHHTIVVDTCIGNDKQGRHYPPWNNLQGPYLQDLAKAGVPPESVDFVFCTHLHVDHVGWNTRLQNGHWVPTFPNAKYLFNKVEYEHWEKSHEPAEKAVFDDSVLPIMQAKLAQLVSADYQIDDGLVLESTPGHTPGHCSLDITSNGQLGVITGDMFHHPVQIAENAYSSAFDVDKPLAIVTRRKFCEKYTDRDVRILGTHFAPPSAGRIVAKNGQWRLQV